MSERDAEELDLTLASIIEPPVDPSRPHKPRPKSRYVLGGSLRAADGLRFPVVEARALGYNAMQIAIGDQQGYEPFEILPQDAAEFKKLTHGMAIFVHMPYVLNPCDPSPQRKSFYRRASRAFMTTAAMLGARAVVIHPGFRKEEPEQKALLNIAKFFDDISPESKIEVLLETDAGSKNDSAVGSLEFLAKALKIIDHERFGICIDTCHLFARGVSLWDDATREQVLHKYGHQIRLVHLNSPDPEVTLGSNKDRHNTPFQDRTDLDHAPMIRSLLARYPAVLERRSTAVQEQDAAFVHGLLKPEPEAAT